MHNNVVYHNRYELAISSLW